MPVEPEPKKPPQQERSRRMRRRILDASIRVLRDEGALGFTTTKVADEAEISVGSLYQYFPNKQAIVIAIHDEDLASGWDTANRILERTEWSPRRKLTELTRWFFDSEADEAETFGRVIGDLGVFLHANTARQRDPELATAATRRAGEFIDASSDVQRSPRELAFAADYLFSTVEAMAKETASRALTQRERRKWADNTATMLATHLAFTTAPMPQARRKK